MEFNFALLKVDSNIKVSNFSLDPFLPNIVFEPSFMIHGVFKMLAVFASILCDLFGTESLAANLGLDMFNQGISTMLGIIFGGVLYDITKSYTWIYNFTAICLGCGEIVCCIIYLHHKKIKSQR